MSFDIKSTDRQVITVSLRNAISEPLTGTVEVHGIVKGKNNVVCNYFMAIPSDIASTFGKLDEGSWQEKYAWEIAILLIYY